MAKPVPDPLDLAESTRPGDLVAALVQAIARLGTDPTLDRDQRLLRAAELLRDALRADIVELWLVTHAGAFERVGSAPRDAVAGEDATRWRARLATQRTSMAMVAGRAMALDVGVTGARGVLGALRCIRQRATRDWNASQRTLATTAADRIAILIADETARPARQHSPEIGRVVQGFAHDLGNTLTAALGHVQLIADSPSPATAAVSARSAIAALEFACRLTHQLRALGDGSSRPFGPVSLDDVVAGIDGLLRAVVGRQRHLEFDLSAGTAVLLGDAEAIARLAFNLVTNARDATRAGGVITIATRDENDHATLIVRDDGEGMPAEVRRRLFEPGFTTKAARGGSGLGLVAVRAIAEAHGAQVEVESEPGRGTAVTVRFSG